MIKAFLKYFSFALIIAFSFSSCDYVDKPGDGEITPPPVGGEDTRRVLVIDFTGHRCAGCPTAAKEANAIAKDFSERVFALSIHPDIEGLTDPQTTGDQFNTDWRTPEGNQYQDQYEVPGAIPTGTVSGTEVNGSVLYASGTWRGQAESLIAEERPVTIETEVTFNDNTRVMDISSNIEFHMSLDGDYNLVLATIENNIIDWQKNGTSQFPADSDFSGGNIPDYIHKHVLRNHINGLTGESLVTGSVDAGATFENNNTSTLPINIGDDDGEEVSIYAYIYEVNSFEIIDVTEVHVIGN